MEGFPSQFLLNSPYCVLFRVTSFNFCASFLFIRVFRILDIFEKYFWILIMCHLLGKLF